VINLTANDIWPYFISPLIGLLAGSFPTAYIISKSVVDIDPRKFGSGSVSTRNTIRAAGLWPWGAITFSVDVVKGMVAAAIVEYLIAPFGAAVHREYYVILTAFFAVIGHCWMPYLKFKGGKGLGTYVGLLFYFYWPTAFFWVIMLFLLIRISGFSGIGAVWAATFITPFWYLIDLFVPTPNPFTFGLPAAFWPHEYFADGLGWQFILLYALGSMVILLIRHLPEYQRIKRGEAQAWKSLKTSEMLK